MATLSELINEDLV